MASSWVPLAPLWWASSCPCCPQRKQPRVLVAAVSRAQLELQIGFGIGFVHPPCSCSCSVPCYPYPYPYPNWCLRQGRGQALQEAKQMLGKLELGEAHQPASQALYSYTKVSSLQVWKSLRRSPRTDPAWQA